MFDGIIVGAGPAGSTAGYHHAKQGLSVLVLEKASLPRNKPGGGFSGAIAPGLDFDRTPAISLKANKISYTSKMQEPVKVEIDSSWMVQPDVFDDFLIKQAQKTGAELKDSTEVKGIEFKNSVWEVKTNSESVSGCYLIASDSDGGPMTQWLALKEPKLCLSACLETRSIKGESLNFDFGTIKKGLIWSFPQADGYSLSILKRSPKNRQLIWFAPVAWLGHSISLLERIIELASNCRSLRRSIGKILCDELRYADIANRPLKKLMPF